MINFMRFKRQPSNVGEKLDFQVNENFLREQRKDIEKAAAEQAAADAVAAAAVAALCADDLETFPKVQETLKTDRRVWPAGALRISGSSGSGNNSSNATATDIEDSSVM